MFFCFDARTTASRIILPVVSVFFAGVLSATAHAAPENTKVNWSGCYQEIGPNYECATVNVPLDYSAGNKTAAVQLAVVRLPARDPANKIGSILLNPGGPGGSGVNFALFFGPFVEFIWGPEVADRFDIVGFDPRGVGRSTGVKCFGNENQAVEVFTPFPFPINAEEEAAWEAGDDLLRHQCDKRGSKIGNHMSTANVARDMDRIRQALGESGLNFVGLSYGSYVGNVYANMFPENVRAVVIDGVLDPVAWLNIEAQIPFSTRLGSSKGAQDTLDRFFELCIEAAAGSCAFAGSSTTAQELADRYRAIADELLVNPLDLGGFVLTYNILVSATLGTLYNPANYPLLASDLAFVEFIISTGGAGFDASSSADDLRYVNKRGFPNYNNFVEAFPSVACSDSTNPDDYGVWSVEGANADLTSYFGRLWTWISSPCARWPYEDVGRYEGDFMSYTENPVLVIGNFYDPATPYEGAVTARGLLPNSILLNVDLAAHTSLGASPCAGFFTGLYLLDPSSIGFIDGQTCSGLPGNGNPFDLFGGGGFGAADDATQLGMELRRQLLSEIAFGPRR